MKIYSYSQVVVTNGTIQIHAINDQYNAYRIETKSHTGSFSSSTMEVKPRKVTAKVRDAGVCTKPQTTFLLEGRPFNKPNIIALSQGDIDSFRFNFFEEAYQNVEELNCFEVAVNGGGTFVRVDSTSYMLFDIDGNPFPTAQHYDYIMAGMSNKQYDLVAVYKELDKRDDITWIEEGIGDIPYYNREDDRDRCIEFMWSPSVEDYRKMWDWCLVADKKYPSTEFYKAQEALDILNIQQYRKR